MTTTKLLCSRCGTPFPLERDKTTVTCVVCGQLRPDLDITLDDDDDLSGAFGTGTAGAPLKPATETHAEAPAPQAVRSHLVISQDPGPARPEQPFVSMGEEMGSGNRQATSSDSLSERIGPVLMVAAPLAAGMGGALNMLSLVPDFSRGSWYAVGTVLLAILLGSLIAGLVASGIVYALRLRWTILLRVVFLAAAASVAYVSVREVPSHVQVRENDLPGIMLRH